LSTGFIPPFGSPATSGVVAADLPCRKCSYNRRGLPTEGRCPECGTPVGLSLQGDLLRYSDPQWLDTLRQGIKLMLIGIGIVVLAAIATVVSAAVHHRGVVLTLVSWAGNITMLAGTWLLTAPDPSGLGEERYGKARKLVRVALIGDLVGSFISFANLAGPVAPGMAMLIGIAVFISGALALIGYIAQLYYIERLAMRIPDEGLAARAHFLTWHLPFRMAVSWFWGSSFLLQSRPGVEWVGRRMKPGRS
jgi:hypothetical protein